MGNCKIILQQIVSEYDNSQRWKAICRCGSHMKGSKRDYSQWAKEHGDRVISGPRVITSKLRIHIPRAGFPKDRWSWHAHNDGEDGEPWFHGIGRSEDEAIDDLEGIDDVRRMTRFHQNAGFPRDAAWLDFFKYDENERIID